MNMVSYTYGTIWKTVNFIQGHGIADVPYHSPTAFRAQIYCQKGLSLFHHITSTQDVKSACFSPGDYTDRARNRFLSNKDQISATARAG